MKTISTPTRPATQLRIAWHQDSWSVPVVPGPVPSERGQLVCLPKRKQGSRPWPADASLDPIAMPKPNVFRASRGFTLTELLVVIAIIAVLAGLALPAVNRALVKGKTTKAKVETGQIAAAIADYQSKYQIFPTSKATAASNADVSFRENNSDVIVILLDEDREPNLQHARNTQRHQFLSAPVATDDKSPGVGRTDRVYRDPWGQPYTISLDLNYDNVCNDPVHGAKPQQIVVWSYGPDKTPNTKDDVGNWK